MASGVHVYYVVKYDVDHCNLAKSAAESQGNVGNFRIPG